MKTINIKLLSIFSMKQIRVVLDTSRIIEYSDGRKGNKQRTTTIPKELIKYTNIPGIYFFCRNGKVLYIGQTKDILMRMRNHSFLKKNKDIKYIFFYEVKERKKRIFFEMLYKYHYLGKIDFEEDKHHID